jgi:hypothetical protein
MNSPNIKRQMQTVWVHNNVAFLLRYWWTAKDALNRVTQTPESFDEFKDNDPASGYVTAASPGIWSTTTTLVCWPSRVSRSSLPSFVLTSAHCEEYLWSCQI